MPDIQPVTATQYAKQRWKRYTSYRFAAADAVCPLVVQELPKAMMVLPIGFIKVGKQLMPAAVQGLQPGRNLFVGPDGKWLAGYTPAAYRGYPFVLANSEDGKQVLCIDEESGLVSESDGELFFDEEGKPAKALADVFDFLTQVARNRQLTQRICAVLEKHELIQPWPVKVKTEDDDQKIEGLYRIDEAALNRLEAEAFEEIRQSGALPMIYCQLLSMQHLPVLGRLAQARAREKAPVDTSALNIVEELFGEEDDILKFDF